jgi:hypothetical protein
VGWYGSTRWRAATSITHLASNSLDAPEPFAFNGQTNYIDSKYYCHRRGAVHGTSDLFWSLSRDAFGSDIPVREKEKQIPQTLQPRCFYARSEQKDGRKITRLGLFAMNVLLIETRHQRQSRHRVGYATAVFGADAGDSCLGCGYQPSTASITKKPIT